MTKEGAEPNRHGNWHIDGRDFGNRDPLAEFAPVREDVAPVQETTVSNTESVAPEVAVSKTETTTAPYEDNWKDSFDAITDADAPPVKETAPVKEISTVAEKIKAIGAKYGVTIEEMERDYCVPTDFTGDAYRAVEALLHRNFPDVAVVPFLLTAGTDARRFSDIADHILRFAPIDLNKKQFATIHAADEHIGIENIGECVVFYKDLIQLI